MKKVFLGTMSFVAFLLAVVCWGNINPVYAAGKPVAEIISVESPKNVEDYTIIPVLVKNNSREELKGVHLVLHGYDKQKEKIFESGLVSRNDTSY